MFPICPISIVVVDDGDVYFLKKFPAVVVRLEATFCVFPDVTVTTSETSEFLFKACCSVTAVVEAEEIAEFVTIVILVESPRFDT